MLSRLVRCIVCGGTYSAQTPHPENNLTYYVHLHKSRSRCDAARSSAARIRADKIERAVLAELFHLFQHAPARELAVQQGAPAKDKRDALTAELAVIQRELDTVNRERENFVEAMKALGPAAVTDGFRNELMKMAHRESSLGAQLQALNDEIAHTPSGLQLAEREQAVARELERVRLELFRDPCHFEDLTADEKQRLVNWAFPDPWEDMRPKAGVYVWRERDLWRYRLVVHLETKWPMPPTDRTRTLPLSDEVVADLIGATHCDAGRLGSSPAVVRTTVPLTITGQIVH